MHSPSAMTELPFTKLSRNFFAPLCTYHREMESLELPFRQVYRGDSVIALSKHECKMLYLLLIQEYDKCSVLQYRAALKEPSQVV